MTTPVSLLRAPKMHALKQEGQRYCRAYQTALRVLERNCVTRPEALIQAGGCYPDAWTRDTAYNTWMGCNLLCPELARATLLKPIRIGGDKEISGLTHPAQPEKYDQYWDKMLWTVAALDYAELNRDLNFLTMSYEVSAATLDKLEKRHIHPEYGLLLGPAFLCDGIGSLPADICSPEVVHPPYSNVMDYEAPHQIMTLSSNCILVGAYRAMAKMARKLHTGMERQYERKAQALCRQINAHLWNQKQGRYDFFTYGFSEKAGTNCTSQEGAGQALAVLFDVADNEQCKSIFRHIHTEPWGIPLSWPSMENHYIGSARFLPEASGYDTPQNVAIWPNVCGLWGRACAMKGMEAPFIKELNSLTELILRSDDTICEIYHALTGKSHLKYHEEKRDQTWSATAYLNMILHGMLGLRYDGEHLQFHPILPGECGEICFDSLVLQNGRWNIRLIGEGTEIQSILMDDQLVDSPCFPMDDSEHFLTMRLKKKG